jgi:GT2 family glycosyltransferase
MTAPPFRGAHLPDRLDLDIGVIYTHEREFTPALLRSLAASVDEVRARLLLVDNASADGVAQWAPLFPHVEPIVNSRRMTYAENLNRVLHASTARYVLLLNTDMLFDPHAHCLSQMVRFMDRHPRCGLAGCRLLHADGSEAHAARRFQTPRVVLARRLRWGADRESIVRAYLYGDRSPGDTFRCDWLSGCFLLVRREAWRQVGGLDEGFRKYFEDVDYCLRVAQAGWDVMYHGATYVYHLEQRGSAKLWSRDAWRHLRSYGRFVRKWGLFPVATAPDLAARRAA